MTVLRVPVLSKYEWQKSVKTLSSAAPILPEPINGDRYIVGNVINSDDPWYNHDNEIAQYTSGEWEFLQPFQGIIIYLINDDQLLKYTDKWEHLVSSIEEVESRNLGELLTHDDLGKCFTCENNEGQTFILPPAIENYVGGWFRFIKLGNGRVTIQAEENSTIADSGVGDTLYNDNPEQSFATVTIMIAAVNKWVITGGHGTWITTD